MNDHSSYNTGQIPVTHHPSQHPEFGLQVFHAPVSDQISSAQTPQTPVAYLENQPMDHEVGDILCLIESCKKGCKTKHSLNYHRKEKHGKLEVVTCSTCNAKGSMGYVLDICTCDRRKQQKLEPSQRWRVGYGCALCTNFYPNITEFENHKNVIHMGGNATHYSEADMYWNFVTGLLANPQYVNIPYNMKSWIHLATVEFCLRPNSRGMVVLETLILFLGCGEDANEIQHLLRVLFSRLPLDIQALVASES